MKQLRPYQAKAVSEAWEAMRASDDPVLFIMSVGGGKSLCIADILLTLEKLNKRALCLVNSAELVRNNSKAFCEQGGNPSVFCASLNSHDCSKNIVFATPQSVISAIKRGHKIADITFNLIVVDEAHNINYADHHTIFMQILRHYKQNYKPMRLLGLTGTPYRFNGIPIAGDDCLFKTEVANITTYWLINNGYLVRPTFEIPSNCFDFSRLKVKSTGKFSGSELQEIINKQHRLTGKILIECQEIMKSRNGAFIFCATVKHCQEAHEALPPSLTRIITGETPDKERHEILTAAREGKIKYLLSVNCLLVGIDVPNFDTSIWLRPTESLVLFIQGIGRALRLHESKRDALVLDFAGNLDRHQHLEDPILLEALKPKSEQDPDYPIMCYTCNTANRISARRCIGTLNDKRCDYYFEFKPCHKCEAQNDITSRYCHACECELIDPNQKLKIIKPIIEAIVFDQLIQVDNDKNGKALSYRITYNTSQGKIFEGYSLSSTKAKNIFYGNFVRKHVPQASKYYMQLSNFEVLTNMPVNKPAILKLTEDKRIKSKVFS